LGENPIDEHNHALAALRYLVSRLDARFIARLRLGGPLAPRADSANPLAERADHHDLLRNEAVWETLR
jgi:hypothetical protein